MEIKAQLKGLRIAPRKVRGVAFMLKGLDAVRAKSQLDYLAKRSAKPLAKLLDSAMANALNNHRIPKDNLFIKNIVVDEGTKLKRGRPKGFGTVSPIEKKTSHIRIILDERVPGMKVDVHKPTAAEDGTHAHRPAAGEGKKPSYAKTKETKDAGKKGVLGGIKGLGKRFFRRKAI